MKTTPLSIIGGGIAGISAAIYAQRAGLECVLFESKGIGGQIAYMATVENYAGIAPGTPALELTKKLTQSLEALAIKPIFEEITALRKESGNYIITAGEHTYASTGVIVATGASHKKLNVSGENEFAGKGVSYCAVCDGFFFRNKDVAVIGGGNTAVEEALYLSTLCRKVYLIHRRDSLRAMEYLQAQIQAKQNIEIIFSSTLETISGSENVQHITVKSVSENTVRTVAVQGVFVAIGVQPATELFKAILPLTEDGFIITDEHMRIASEAMWACGDCRNRPLRQLITAASEGAIAALSAYKQLKGGLISA